MESSVELGNRMTRMSKILYTLLLLCISSCVLANENRIALLLSGKADFYHQTAEQLQQTLAEQAEQPVSVDIFQLGDHSISELDSGKYCLLVPVGTAATRFALTRTHTVPVLATFIPQSGFEKISKQTRLLPERDYAAIYLDQPLSRFIQLSKLLKPDANNIGTLLGPASKSQLPALQKIVKSADLTLKYAEINENDNPLSKLGPVINQIDLFIALPDNAVLNRTVAKWILYLSFQQKIPVIGFSSAYTDAGALASVYTSPENVGVHAGELIAQWLNSGNNALLRSQHPAYFTISVNHAVARSLEIYPPSDETLKQKLTSRDAMANE